MCARSAGPGSGAGRRRFPATKRCRTICATGVRSISSAIARDSDAQFPTVRAPDRAGRHSAHIKPVRPRLKKARSGCSAVVQQAAATETNMQFRKKPGEPHGPQAEVGDGAPDAARLPRRADVPARSVSRRKYRSFGSPAAVTVRKLRRNNPAPRPPGNPTSNRNCETSSSQESRLTSSRFSRWKYDIRTCESRSNPEPKALFGRRARLATPRSLP